MKTATCLLALFSSFLATATMQAAQTDIHGPAGSGFFGSSVTVLPNGNIIVPDPDYSVPSGAANVGAVYLYGPDGTLISSITGSTAGDQVGGGITVLSNNNFVISSPAWSNAGAASAGAVTWCSGTTGVGLNVTVSAANSLVGTTANDRVSYNPSSAGELVIALTNGNYVVGSPAWHNGALDVGAVTWCNGTTGTVGAVTTANSLTGTLSGDAIGSVVVALANGNYVVDNPFLPLGGVNQVGAVTWCDGTKATASTVSATNSLVGTTQFDRVGYGLVFPLTNGNYVVSSYQWNNGGNLTTYGAVTWGNGTGGTVGAVSSSNSLVGSTANDQVGVNGVTALSNGSYVVVSETWTNAGAANAGAVTWGNSSGGTVGAVTSSNSLVGSTANDLIGSGSPGIHVLGNGNYVVTSPAWHNAGVVNAGAATWGSEATGISGAVSSSNSLVGSTAGDQVGSFGVTVLKSNNNYVVVSPLWNNNLGAATWGSGTSGISGAVSSSNSLVGSTANDQVSSNGVTALTNGHYVVNSQAWNNGGAANTGAVTWGNGASGITGPVSTANSLVGSAAGSYTGEVVTALTNGSYVVHSANSDNGVAFSGAATWRSGAAASPGVVSTTNSLVGSTFNDQVGYGVVPLSDGNYVVSSPGWANGAIVNAGAATWCSGTQITSMAVSAANSLVGSSHDDQIGSLDNFGDGGVYATSDGRYVVSSPVWDNVPDVNDGAVTLGFGSIGNIGHLSSINGVLGTASATFDSQPVSQPGTSARLTYAYDAGHGQLVVGRYASSIVTLFRPTPGIEVALADDTFIPNGQPAAVPVPSVVAGSTSSITFTIKNPGLGNLTGLGVTVTNDTTPDFTLTSTPTAPVSGPRGTTTFTIQYAPAAVGTTYAYVSIPSNDPDPNSSPYTFYVVGTASAPPAPQIAVSLRNAVTNGGTVDFSTHDVATSTSLSVTVANTGNAPLTITSIADAGGNAGDFSVDLTGTLFTIPVGNNSTTFDVTFTPSAPGTRSTTLNIASNDPGTPAFSITLSGTGNPLPETFSFGAASYNASQNATSVLLTVNHLNSTAAAVTINTGDGTASTAPPIFPAVAGQDYTALAGAATTVTFLAGDTSKTVPVTLIPHTGNLVFNKRFTATLSAPSDGAALGLATTTVQILVTDTTKPTVIFTAPASEAKVVTTATTVTVTGTASDKNGLTSVQAAFNGSSTFTDVTQGTPVINSAGETLPWSIVMTPVEGNNTVVIKAADLQGNTTTTLPRLFIYHLAGQLTVSRTVPAAIPALLPDNVGLVTATGATLTTGANVNPRTAVVQLGLPVTLTATSKTGYMFEGWSTSPTVTFTSGTAASAAVTFAMVPNLTVTAQWVVNPYIAGAGAYAGLVHTAAGVMVSNATEGALKVTLTNTGSFTGTLLIDGGTHAFTGSFDVLGASVFGTARTPTLTIVRTPATSPPLVLDLTFNAAAGDNQITGMLKEQYRETVQPWSTLTADRAAFSESNPVPSHYLVNKGYYTVVIPSQAQTNDLTSADFPQGSGIGSISVSITGNVTLSAVLADGAAVTATAPLNAALASPLFAQLYTANGGSLGGAVTLDDSQSNQDLTGSSFLWFKPYVGGQVYPYGWPEGVSTTLSGAKYVSVAGTCVLPGLTAVAPPTVNAMLTLSDGGLANPVTKTFNLSPLNVVTKTTRTDLTYALTVTAATGKFTGSFTYPDNTKPAFSGVVFNKPGSTFNGGYGWFLTTIPKITTGTGQSGMVNLGK